MWIKKLKIKAAKISNFFILILVLFLFLPKVAEYFSNTKRKGQSVLSRNVLETNGANIELPLAGTNQVIIFWATWCGPCEAELAMYNKAVEKKLIPAEKVLAVSIGEEAELVKKTVLDRGYKFRTFIDTQGALATVMQVQATPTTVLLNKEMKVVNYGVGISPLALLEAKKLLNAN